MKNGADFFLENNQGKTALDMLLSGKLPDKLESLKEKIILEKELEDDSELTIGL